jgi:sugar O-acyltransferase (sialic acid O-acetyltransferase NeuD family)
VTAKSIVIVGTGGSGRETYALLQDIERHSPGTWTFKGFLGIDAPDADVLRRLNEPFLGSPHHVTDNIPDASDWAYAVGIGDPQHRRAMDALLIKQGLRPATLIHPTTLIGPDVKIAEGAVICANCVITTNVRIGTSAQINIGCNIAHDARTGDYITLAQRVNIAGSVSIDDDATIFTGASILPGIRIGKHAVIAAGSVVTHDVAPQATVAGVPAKPLV